MRTGCPVGLLSLMHLLKPCLGFPHHRQGLAPGESSARPPELKALFTRQVEQWLRLLENLVPLPTKLMKSGTKDLGICQTEGVARSWAKREGFSVLFQGLVGVAQDPKRYARAGRDRPRRGPHRRGSARR